MCSALKPLVVIAAENDSTELLYTTCNLPIRAENAHTTRSSQVTVGNLWPFVNQGAVSDLANRFVVPLEPQNIDAWCL